MTVNSLADRPIALIDLLDRLLQGGVVITGDLVLSIADVDLVRIDLRAVIAPVAAAAVDNVAAAHPAPPL
ncbi:gas vesicle protein [Streptomyces sp. NL15-2K]|uniref:gas vesicle protein n=1 Tax=Streptomyces sp. NL15-2K TaxID=376149 RepID=UPI000F583FA0|nr:MULTISPECIES: gas vesicle protein [Actinomycetes]WKX15741.1 gas vesicle protein [Kutzneria buriramensis]GCB43998.1 gas vesicle synthesis protein [Streptomyces sp. NL15-2K]